MITVTDLFAKKIISEREHLFLQACSVNTLEDIAEEWEQLLDYEEFSYDTLIALKTLIKVQLNKEVNY